MKKPITEKYYIKTFIGELFETTLKVSKKEFAEQLANNIKIAHKEGCFQQENDGYKSEIKIEDKKTFTKVVYYFSYGTSEILLIKYKCKDGYYFTK